MWTVIALVMLPPTFCNMKGLLSGGEQPRLADGVADAGMAEHVGIGRLAENLVRRPQRKVMQDDRQPAALAQIDVAVDVSGGQRVFEAAGDFVLRQAFEQVGHVIVGAVHGEVVMDAESFRGHLLHRLGLVEDVLERGKVVLEPGVSLAGVLFDGLGHALRVRRNRPAADRHPGAVLLSDQLVDRNAGGLAHQVVHRRAQTQAGLVSHPVEGVGADVLVDDFLRLGTPALAEADQSLVGLHLVDGAPGRAVVMVQLVGDPVDVLQLDFVYVDVGDLHVDLSPLGPDVRRVNDIHQVQQAATSMPGEKREKIIPETASVSWGSADCLPRPEVEASSRWCFGVTYGVNRSQPGSEKLVVIDSRLAFRARPVTVA